jgi:hypothetical protein
MPARAGVRGWLQAAGRVAIPAIVAGIATAIMATDRITWSLALSGTACWILLSIVQLLTAATLVLPHPRRVNLPRAVDLFFLGHGAWSLWLLASAALVFVSPIAVPAYLIVFSAVVPLLLTAILTFAYCRRVLGLGRRPAAVRTLVHQSLTAVFILLYVGWAVQLWPRILSLFTP